MQKRFDLSIKPDGLFALEGLTSLVSTDGGVFPFLISLVDYVLCRRCYRRVPRVSGVPAANRQLTFLKTKAILERVAFFNGLVFAAGQSTGQ